MRPKVKTTQKLDQKLKLKNHPLKDSKSKLKPNTKLKPKLKNQPLKTPTKPKLKRGRKRSRCSMFMSVSCAIIWLFRFSAAKNPRANVFPGLCKPCRLKRWYRIEGQSRLARRIFSGKTLRARAGFSFRTAKANRNMGGPRVGA